MRFAARFGPGGGYSPAAASGGANSTTFQVTELMPLRLQHGDRGACRRRRQWAVIGICPLPVTEMSLCLTECEKRLANPPSLRLAVRYLPAESGRPELRW